MGITFHSEHTGFRLTQKERLKKWIGSVILEGKKRPEKIAFIFTSNESLREINRTYLNHNYFTDVITFGYGEEDRISGDIFISVEQVKMNAGEYGITFGEELRRVMIHGILHLMGFDDRNKKERDRMRELEDEALILWNQEKGNG